LRENASPEQAEAYQRIFTAASDLMRDGLVHARELSAAGRFREAIEAVEQTPATHKDYYHGLMTRIFCAGTRRTRRLRRGDRPGAEAQRAAA
jgi:hypothetical protein